MNERVARMGRWHRSGSRIVVLDDQMPTDAVELDEVRIAGLHSAPPLLRRGSRGAAVASLQRGLNTWVGQSRLSMAPLKEDGIFGPLTEARVRSFQRAKGLLIDGIAGPRTLNALRTTIQGIGDLTIPASVVRESPCLSSNPIIPSTLPRCYCVGGYETDQRKVGDGQRMMVEFIAADIVRSRTPQGVGPPVNRVTIVGHTDSDGGPDFNLQLGTDRARGVERVLREVLGRFGIPAPFLSTHSRGESEPIKSNNTAEGKAANRRVEVCLFG